MNILFFGRLSEASDPLSLDLPEGVEDTETLTNWLESKYPWLRNKLRVQGNRIAVNKTMIYTNTALSNSDEIAFMSPLSGG